MKTKIKVEQEITITHIKISIPVRYGDEDMPSDFPLRHGDKWSALVNIDTGEIHDWPKDPRFQQCAFEMKVCDEGTYTLFSYFGDHWTEMAKIDSDYVPHGVVPGSYGDYVKLDIDGGRITNWPKHPDVSKFFDRE